MKWSGMRLSDVERECFVVSCDSAALLPSRCLFLWLRKLLINFKWRFAERLRFPQIPSQSDLRYSRELVLILMDSAHIRLLPFGLKNTHKQKHYHSDCLGKYFMIKIITAVLHCSFSWTNQSCIKSVTFIELTSQMMMLFLSLQWWWHNRDDVQFVASPYIL